MDEDQDRSVASPGGCKDIDQFRLGRAVSSAEDINSINVLLTVMRMAAKA
jgi:hypothetical protein